MKRDYCFTLILIIFFAIGAKGLAQEAESATDSVQKDSTAEKNNLFQRVIRYFEEAKKDKSAEKFDVSFIAGPNYSVDTKFGIGLVASGLYRLDKENLDLSPSDISVYSNITTSGFFTIGVENNTILKSDNYRINGDFNFAYMPTRYYGIGFEAGDQENYSKFDKHQIYFKADFLKKFLKNTYGGITLTLKDNWAKSFADENLKPDAELHNTIFGPGFILSYDSRDFIPNPSKGWYAKYEQRFYPGLFGNSRHFNQIDLTLRTYHQLWPKTILAFDLNGIFNNADVPWNMMSQLGGSRQMRGYYKGQYRDKKQINSQIEIRQKIYNRHGIALWGGAGKIFDSFKNFDVHHILPTYGIGYRWEFKSRVNIRLDYGIGKGQSGFYFNINEAF